MRSVPRLLLCAFVLATVPSAGVAQDIEPVLLELRLGRYAARTVPAHRSGNDALLPVLQVFDLAEMRTQWSRDSTLTALIQPGNRRFTIEPRRRRATLDGSEWPLTEADLLTADGEVYLNQQVFKDALGWEWQTSWEDLEVTLGNPDDLPVARRIRREMLAAARTRPDDLTPVDGTLREYPRPVEGAVLDYSLLVPTDPGPNGGAYAVGLGLNVLGGALDSRVQNEGPVDQGTVRTDVSWLRVWPGSKWLAQLRLGDGYASGTRTRSLRGISLGNAPFRRPEYIGQLPFTGTLGPGWQLEIYRGGRLIAFDSVNALGQFSIDVPIQYGENPVDFIAYGPFGEVRQFNQTYRVSTDVIRPKRFEYGLAGGACRVEACDATANIDLRYGLSTRWTIFAGGDRFWRDTLPDLVHPYAGVLGSLSNAIGFEAEAVGDAVLRAAIRIEPSVNYVVMAEASRYDTDVVEPLLTVAGRRSQYTIFAQAWPIPGKLRNWLGFDANLDWTESLQDRRTSGRVAASLQPGNARFIPFVRWTRTEVLAGGTNEDTRYGLNLVTLPFVRAGAAASLLSTRSGVEFQPSEGIASANLFVSARIASGLRAEVGGTWQRDQRVAFSALFTADLRTLRAHTTAEVPATGPGRLTQQVQGSLLYDRGTGTLQASAGPSLQLGGVSGRVFLDLNANGVFDEGEFVVPDVRIRVGIYSERTDSSGAYRIWQLPAYERLVASVDTTTIPSPFWIPAYSAVAVTSSPNRFVNLNFPLVAGGMVEGFVQRQTSTGTQPLAGAVVLLLEQRSGRRREVTTFTDGSFYVLGLPPGEWEVTIDPALLDRLGQRADPLRFTIKQLLEGQSVSGVNLLIR